MLVYGLLANLLLFMPTVYMLEVYDRVLNSSSVNTLLSLTALAVVVYAALSVIDWVRTRPNISPISYVALRLADDMAYGAGVWVGSVRAGTIEPLIPDVTSWPKASRYTRWRIDKAQP